MQTDRQADTAPSLETPPHETLTLPNPRHEAFAQATHHGQDPAETYQRLFRCKPATAQVKGPLLQQDPTIAARIASLQREACHIATHHAHFTKADLIAFLVETIQTPVSSIDQHHRQCQEWTRDELTTSGRRATATTQQKTQSETPESAGAGEGTTISPSRKKPTASTRSAKSTPPTSGIDTEPPPAPTPILLRSKTKVPSKLDAAKLLATLCGWHAPAKLESNVALGLSPTVEEALSRLLR